MFRPVRRKQKEIPQAQAKALLHSARWGMLAVNGDEGYPYAVPVNYLYDEAAEKIYFHGAKAGHKAEAIRNCDKVCFTVCGPETVKEEAWAPYAQSTVVFGRCHAVQSPDAMSHLKRFAMKYYPDEPTADTEMAASGKAVCLYVIEIEHLTGKEIQER